MAVKANGLNLGLMNSQEIDGLISWLTKHKGLSPAEIASIVHWCNSVRINSRLLDGLFQSRLYITDVVRGEPIFMAVDDELENKNADTPYEL